MAGLSGAWTGFKVRSCAYVAKDRLRGTFSTSGVERFGPFEGSGSGIKGSAHGGEVWGRVENRLSELSRSAPGFSYPLNRLSHRTFGSRHCLDIEPNGALRVRAKNHHLARLTASETL